MTPDHLDHPALGRLDWDDRLSWFKGQMPLDDGSTVEITLNPFSELLHPYPDRLEDPVEFLDRSVSTLSDLAGKLDAMKEYAADRLLDVYNDGWRSSYRQGDWLELPALDRGGFVAQLALRSIGVDAGRECEVQFDDGGMFAGHAVFVSTDASGAPVDCVLFG